MTTYQLQRKILDAGLSMSEAFIGFVYALHLNKKTGEIKVKQEVIAHKCGCSVSTVKRAVKALCLAGIWQVQKRRGAAAIIPISGNTGKNTGTDSSLVTPNKSHRWTIIATRVTVDDPGLMNSGKNATKNSMTFGLVRLMTRALRK